MNHILEQINSSIDEFAERVASKFSLDKDEIMSLWTDSSESKSGSKSEKPKKSKANSESVKSLAKVDMDDLSIERLTKCGVAELKALCKSKGCKCTGKKAELIDRLLGRESNEDDTDEKKPVKKAASKPAKEKKDLPKAARADASLSVIKKLTSDVPAHPIRRNAHGNYEHPATGLVFNQKTKKVIGKQLDDGTVSSLSDADIQQCKKYKFDWETPDNLDENDDEEVKADSDEEDVELPVEDEDVELDEEDEGSEEELED